MGEWEDGWCGVVWCGVTPDNTPKRQTPNTKHQHPHTVFPVLRTRHFLQSSIHWKKSEFGGGNGWRIDGESMENLKELTWWTYHCYQPPASSQTFVVYSMVRLVVGYKVLHLSYFVD
ncbi:hypothetical protein BHYA_0101g00050 [Botrytis hyacinthi]|uniref:Uncharacterized protein n=1 Tax=Botrytis hyacinthi TaxID=278943 RepID=A0A4Z1GV55_9HELO|nr:hypothetical protein BHYA_0101g00050 [Botrytis hyacinthi]